MAQASLDLTFSLQSSQWRINQGFINHILAIRAGQPVAAAAGQDQ